MSINELIGITLLLLCLRCSSLQAVENSSMIMSPDFMLVESANNKYPREFLDRRPPPWNAKTVSNSDPHVGGMSSQEILLMGGGEFNSFHHQSVASVASWFSAAQFLPHHEKRMFSVLKQFQPTFPLSFCPPTLFLSTLVFLRTQITFYHNSNLNHKNI